MLESWGCGLYTSAAYTRVFTVILNLISYFSVKSNLSDGLLLFGTVLFN